MSTILMRLLQAVEVILIYKAIKAKYNQRHGDPHGDSQQQYQTDTCEPAPHSQQPQDRQQSSAAHSQNI
jgi:hypothetical protein